MDICVCVCVRCGKAPKLLENTNCQGCEHTAVVSQHLAEGGGTPGIWMMPPETRPSPDKAGFVTGRTRTPQPL